MGIVIAGVVVGALVLMIVGSCLRKRRAAAKRPATMVFDPNFFASTANSKNQESVPLTSQTNEHGALSQYHDKPGSTTGDRDRELDPFARPHPTYTDSSAAYSYSNASLGGPPLQHADVIAPTPINPATAAPIAFDRASSPSKRALSPPTSPPFAPRLDSPRFEGLGVLPALQPGSRDSSIAARSSRGDMQDMFFTTPPASPLLGAATAHPWDNESAETGKHAGDIPDEDTTSHEGEASTSSHLPYPGDALSRGRAGAH